ncbi:MAG: hypothetical protein CBE00_00995 [Planctomycetaceae bacterium TMED240]|nr:hypothetical protein [Rhodopirellula sp.]OUX08791.1 MAG: hypothetical protein CBE00_00995 [Planctomycetaceae bacterium TMED240]
MHKIHCSVTRKHAAGNNACIEALPGHATVHIFAVFQQCEWGSMRRFAFVQFYSAFTFSAK